MVGFEPRVETLSNLDKTNCYNLTMDKRRLRQRLKLERLSLSRAEVDKLSHQIINNCWALINWEHIHSLHLYLPLNSQNEIDTLPFLRAAKQLNSDMLIAASLPNGETIKTVWLVDETGGIKQVPENFQFNLIIVPMLAFDKHGTRLGYGGGFYDRFLASQPHAQIIGLCYEFGHLNHIPAEEHDVPLKLVATEERVYKF